MSVILNGLQDTAHPYHRIGYSKKGWTNGEIGVEWVKEFDRHTKAKANRHY